MRDTWKPLAGGILSIVAGALAVGCGLFLLLLGGALSGFMATPGVPDRLFLLMYPIMGAVSLPVFVLGAIAIAGGACAVRRRTWPLALTGAICALFLPQVGILGILAIVFIVMGKDEFE